MLAKLKHAAAVGLVLSLALPLVAQPADQREAVRQELTPVLMRLIQPLFSAPDEGMAWVIEASAAWNGRDGEMLLAWDREGRHRIRVRMPDLVDADASFLPEGSRLSLPAHGVSFRGSPKAPVSGSPIDLSRLWPIVKAQLGAGVALVRTAKLPEGLRLVKTGDSSYHAEDGRWAVDVEGKASGGPIAIRVSGPATVSIRIGRIERIPRAEFLKLSESGDSRAEAVDDDDLRWMLATAVDMLSEKALWAIRPSLVPPLVPEDLKVDGHAVLVLRGSPEEIGTRYGERLKEAVTCNLHRILHGIGLVETIRTGKWFPRTLADTWQVQEKYIDARFIREMDALAAAVGARREHVRWTNVFPERFHCSGLGLRGDATEGGRLLHGRILDYMTEVGFQATAVVTVIAPSDRIAWLNVGYAGCLGTVTAMNERGLAMGEMGGRGEGHTDGLPMTFLMREVVERFETTDDALAWIRSVPRTCEYFYVLSDSKTRSIAGIASWARSLARERGTDDLLVLRPGDSHPLLPHGIKDAVLMSAGGRYERLVERVRASYGKITPQVAWEIMGEGVAMRSALHIALFQPETLDVWVAEASLDARPAYTQHVSKLNLRRLLGATPISSAQR